MNSMSPHRAGGFTLLELLVAMGIFAVIGAMALGGLNAIVGQSTQAGQQNDRLTELQRAMRLIANDLSGTQPRFVRDELGGRSESNSDGDPIATDRRGLYLVQLSRGGWTNPARLPHRGTLQRVQYRLDDGKLLRDYWPVMEHVLGQEPRSEELLTGVKDLKLQFLDDTENGPEFKSEWPPLKSTNPTPGRRPRAIQISIELDDWGTIERLVEVAQ